jgi:hypothetical protein
LADFDMLNARSRAVLARLAVDLTILVTDSSVLAGDVVIGSAILSGMGVGFVEVIVESRFRACFLVVEASSFGFFEDEEDLEGDSPTGLVSMSTLRFFLGGDFSCSGALLESNDDLGFEEGFSSVPGLSV